LTGGAYTSGIIPDEFLPRNLGRVALSLPYVRMATKKRRGGQMLLRHRVATRPRKKNGWEERNPALMRSAILEGCASCWDASKSGKRNSITMRNVFLASSRWQNMQVIATFTMYGREKIIMISS